jgi:hypothetical protein
MTSRDNNEEDNHDNAEANSDLASVATEDCEVDRETPDLKELDEHLEDVESPTTEDVESQAQVKEEKVGIL